MTQTPRLDATLCFVNEKVGKTDNKGGGKKDDDEEVDNEEGDEEEDDADIGPWDSGDVGGFECYIEADEGDSGAGEGNEASEVYRADGDGESLLSVSPGCNVLSIVMRDQKIMRFVKYVSSAAPGSRYDITMEYEIEDEGDESDESDESDEGDEGDEER
jgi:hypothetical protein